MEFVFETIYNQKAMTNMAKVLRKTLRKKRSRRSHIFGWIIVILSVFLGWDGLNLDLRRIITWLAILIIVIVLVWEDQINGYMARKRMLAGTDRLKINWQNFRKISTWYKRQSYTSADRKDD